MAAVDRPPEPTLSVPAAVPVPPIPALVVPPLDEPDPRVQMNVRIPKSLRDTIDLRRASLGLTRDEWIKRVCTWALLQPPTQAVQSMNGHRTVRSLHL
jgi:hypothetical protein